MRSVRTAVNARRSAQSKLSFKHRITRMNIISFLLLMAVTCARSIQVIVSVTGEELKSQGMLPWLLR